MYEHQCSTHHSVIDALAEDDIFGFRMFGIDVFIARVPLSDGDLGESPAAHGQPAAHIVVPHHHLGLN